MNDTRDEIQKAATDLVMFYVGYPSLEEHARMQRMMRKHINLDGLRAENAALRQALEIARGGLCSAAISDGTDALIERVLNPQKEAST